MSRSSIADDTSGRTTPWRRLAIAVFCWSLAYAGYRSYYAAGGQLGMIGEPLSMAQFRRVNAIGAALIVAAAIVPLLALRVRTMRRILPAFCWIAAVGCCMHAFVDVTLRVFSLTGVHPTQLPMTFWRSFDRHAADVQDLLVNEPWFFIEGVLWAALGMALVAESKRRAWIVSAAVACVALTIVGVLSGLGVIGSFYFG